MGIEENLKALGLALPKSTKTIGNYVPTVITSSNLLFFSGVIPACDGEVLKGKFGKELTLDDARKPAICVLLSVLSNIKDSIDNLDRIKRIVKIEGYINATEDFQEHPKVMNEISNLLVAIFGDKGKHTRIAIGVCSLPMGACMEVAGIVELE